MSCSRACLAHKFPATEYRVGLTWAEGMALFLLLRPLGSKLRLFGTNPTHCNSKPDVIPSQLPKSTIPTLCICP